MFKGLKRRAKCATREVFYRMSKNAPLSALHAIYKNYMH